MSKPLPPGGGLVLPNGAQQVQVQHIQLDMSGIQLDMKLPIPVTNEQVQLDAIAKLLVQLLTFAAEERADRHKADQPPPQTTQSNVTTLPKNRAQRRHPGDRH